MSDDIKTFTSKEGIITKRPLTGLEVFGKYFVDDALFTAASKLGFDKVEKYFDKKEADAEKAEKAAEKAEIREEKIEAKVEATPPAARRKILEGGEKSFLARRQEEMQNLAPAMAVP